MRLIAWLQTLWTGTSRLTTETMWMHCWGWQAAGVLLLGCLRRQSTDEDHPFLACFRGKKCEATAETHYIHSVMRAVWELMTSICFKLSRKLSGVLWCALQFALGVPFRICYSQVGAHHLRRQSASA